MLSDKSDIINSGFSAQSSHAGTRARSASFTAILFLTALFASGCVMHRNGGYYSPYERPVVIKPRVAVTAPVPITFTFTKHHRHTVREYYHQHPRHHHGKKHKHRKKWRHKRKAHLHSGIRIQEAPYDLIRQLPPAPRGTQFIQDDDQILLIDANTYEVLDFINIPDYDKPRGVVVPAPATYTFSDHHRHTVRNYYHSHPRHHHGKKHKHKRKRHKNKWKHKWKHKRKAHLPREIQVEVVPVALVRQLPPPPRGTRFVYYDDQMMLINVNTRMVLDFIDISVSVGR